MFFKTDFLNLYSPYEMKDFLEKLGYVFLWETRKFGSRNIKTFFFQADIWQDHQQKCYIPYKNGIPHNPHMWTKPDEPWAAIYGLFAHEMKLRLLEMAKNAYAPVIA